MSAHGSFDPLLEVDSIPFVAQTYSMHKNYKASKPELVKGLDEKGISFSLCSSLASSRVI